MTAVSREQVFQAIFGLLDGIPGFVAYSRRMILPAKVEKENQPILLLWEGPEHVEYENPAGGVSLGANYLSVDEWDAAVVIYFFNDDTSVAGGTIINPLVDQVRLALKPNDVLNNANNLGLGIQGLWCRVEGTTMIVTGDTNPNGLGGAVIPLKVKVPTA